MKTEMKVMKSKFVSAKEVFDAKFRMFLASISAAFAMTCPTVGVFCAPSADNIMKSMYDVIFKIAGYIGGLMLLISIMMIVFALKDENAEAQARGVRLLVVSIILLGFKTFTSGFGIF